MLADIRAALKPDGLLYLLEYPKSEAPSTYSCSRRMTEAALLGVLHENGWEPMRQQPLGTGVLYVFRPI